VQPCIEEAVQRAARILEAATDAACAALLEEARKSQPQAQRQAISDAASDLLRLRPSWAQAFPAALRAAASAPASARGAGGGVRISPSSLTLVDDSELVQSIEVSRLAQQLEGRVEKVLGEFDRFMSSALGLDGIQPEANPLRPAAFAQALRSVMNEPPPEPGRSALWMRHMAEPLALELQALYERCAGLLAQARVQAAQYRVVATPGRASRAGGLDTGSGDSQGGWSPSVRPAAPPAGAQASGAGWMGQAMHRLGGRVLRDFLFGAAPAEPQPLAPAFYQAVGQELAALEALPDEPAPQPVAQEDLRELAAVDRPVREVGTATALSPALWGDYGAPRRRSLVRTRLKQQASSADQVMGLDLVRELVEQVARDPRLLAPVREAIVALEPSLGRLALQSPRFFAQHDNPARRLLDGVAQRSLQYNDEFASEFQAFLDPVRDRFNALNRLEAMADASPFKAALTALQAGWDAQDREVQAQREQVLAAVQRAEARQAEAERVAAELSQRSDMEGVPAVVQDFIYGPWALVIAQARLQHPGEVDPGGYARIVADLLWSVRPSAVREPARAFETMPRVLVTLRKGLQALGHPPAETETFFRALERLHWPVMKLRARLRRASTADQEPPRVAPEVLAPAPARKPQARETLFLGEREQKALGFEETPPATAQTSAVAALPQQGLPSQGAVPAAAAGGTLGSSQGVHAMGGGAPGPASGALVAGADPVAGAPAARPADAHASAPGGGQGQAAGAGAASAHPVPEAGGEAPDAMDAAQAEAVITGLREGAWVDLHSHGQWQRARLTWAAGRGTLFMFVSHGNRPHSMTRRTLQRLLMARQLRPVGSEAVVQQALDALAAAEPPAPSPAGAAA